MSNNTIYAILATKPHNEHYLKRYFKFIELYKQKTENYTENHHICPKSLFKEYSNFKEHPWNRIALSYRAHYIAHWILWKAYGGKLTYAFQAMANNQNSQTQQRTKQKINSKTYSKLKSETNTLMSLERKGKPSYKRTQEHRQQHSNLMKIKYKPVILTEESKLKRKAKLANRIWMHNITNKNIRVPLSLLEEALAQGCKMGYAPGTHPGTPKNTGRKHTEETKLKMSATLKGRKYTKEAILNFKIGATKRKNVTCSFCGKNISPSNHSRWHGVNCKQNQFS